LNAYNVYLQHPDSFHLDLDRYLTTTAAGIRDSAGQWLTPDTAVVLSVVPEGQRDLAADDARSVVWSTS
jgi:hypothetical protein